VLFRRVSSCEGEKLEMPMWWVSFWVMRYVIEVQVSRRWGLVLGLCLGLCCEEGPGQGMW